jgi:hypothetical protein
LCDCQILKYVSAAWSSCGHLTPTVQNHSWRFYGCTAVNEILVLCKPKAGIYIQCSEMYSISYILFLVK